MGGVKLVLKNIENPDYLCFEKPTGIYKDKLSEILSKCKDKCNGFVSIEINRPYKPRTIGINSQNNLTWKLLTIIANETGEDIKEVEHTCKMKAIARGYPYHVSKINGQPVPESMTKITTVENSYLIDTCYEVIAFLGIQLEPELVNQEPTQKDTENLVDQALNEYGGIF